MTYSILVVDDEKDIVDSLERQFRKDYTIFKATSGIEALRILQKEKVNLILSDQRMPEMTGVQLFERAQKIQPDAIRMLLTGYTDVASVISAINNGQIYRYITKPWDPTDLEITIKKALEVYDFRVELKDKNQKLEAALAELKTLDQAKSQFMLLIGHELKTPLTTISSFIELAQEEKPSGDLEKYLNRISQGTERLKEIIFDVLDIMNAETGSMKLHSARGKVDPVIKKAIDDLSSLASKRSITVDFKASEMSAVFDSELFTKVFKKILHNGIKFATENSKVKIGVENGEGGVDIFVENIGAPIPAKKIEHILKPFNLDEDIMHHTQGLGLGLSVCQSLLKLEGTGLKITSDSEKTKVGFSLGN